jgi:hypothetical protein
MLALFALGAAVFLMPFAFPTPPPIITRYQATRVFSPGDDGRRDLARASVRVRVPSRVSIIVRDGEGVPVRALLVDEPLRPGWTTVTWGGRDDTGARLPDGTYTIDLNARSGARRFNKSRRIVIDATPPPIAALGVSGAPGGDGCRVEVTAGGAGQVRLEPLTASGAPLPAPVRLGPRPLGEGDTLRWTWDGRDGRGVPVPPGTHWVRATLGDGPGNRAAEQRTCWVGHLAGTATPRPGGRVGVRLTEPSGAPVAASAPVTLTLHERAGTPGEDPGSPLGPRVGRPARGPAGTVTVAVPPARAGAPLWLVASRPGAAALIPVGP